MGLFPDADPKRRDARENRCVANGFFKERTDQSRTMNKLIAADLDRKAGKRLTFGRANGESAALHESLSGALKDLEQAKRSGDADAIHFYEFRVERLTEQAKAAREEESGQVRDPETGQFVSAGFDGGVRGRTMAAGYRAGLRAPTPIEVVQKRLIASRQRRIDNMVGV